MHDDIRVKEWQKLFRCPICGLPMVHSRLRGYHCHDEQCNEQRQGRLIEDVVRVPRQTRPVK